MDMVLLGIAGLSLTLAVVMGVILLRVLRDERERSDARVAILAAAAAQADPLPLQSAAPEPAFVADPAQPASHDLFTRDDAPSPWGRRLAVAGALAAVLAIVGYAVLPGDEPAPAAAAAAAAAVKQAPLELMTLRHVQNGDGLTISGLVHNPRNGLPLSQVSANALLFADDGSLVASGRAALDFTTLAPGDESPFVVTVPVTGAVARYRIGFRAPDGSVIAHVDRRADGTTARNGDHQGSTPWAH